MQEAQNRLPCVSHPAS